ncbi:zinc ribbon domain-containing protein [Enterococcus sp. AZ109]|uniref:zinc ribbon domain-containing protein n=1 Tax=Enterococcus sp. AZ109 TaxID=2774634 RepID=UPI003F2748A9
MKFCPECGEPVMREANFCTNCGHKFEQSTVNTSQSDKEFQNSETIDQAVIPEEVSSNRSMNRKKLGIITGIIIITLIGFFLFAYLNLNNRNEQLTSATSSTSIAINRKESTQENSSNSITEKKLESTDPNDYFITDTSIKAPETIQGTFRLMKNKEIPSLFTSVSATTSQVETTGVQVPDTHSITIDVSIRNLSSQFLVVDPSKFTLVSPFTTEVSLVSSPYNLAIMPNDAAFLRGVFANVNDQKLVEGWQLYYENNLLISAPSGEAGFTETLQIPQLIQDAGNDNGQDKVDRSNVFDYIDKYFQEEHGTTIEEFMKLTQFSSVNEEPDGFFITANNLSGAGGNCFKVNFDGTVDEYNSAGNMLITSRKIILD